MPITAQAKLLQFLDEGFFYPLGSEKPVHPDVRIIVASNVNFEESIEEGKFRKDLFYRISSFPLTVPPMRERTSDIECLSEFLIKKIEDEIGQQGYELSQTALQEMKKYQWPGNIRELHNRLQQGIVKAKIKGDCKIEFNDMLNEKESEKEDTQPLSFAGEKDKWEKQFIQEQLQANNWNVTRTAASLKMSRSHLNRLIKEYKLEKPQAGDS